MIVSHIWSCSTAPIDTKSIHQEPICVAKADNKGHRGLLFSTRVQIAIVFTAFRCIGIWTPACSIFKIKYQKILKLTNHKAVAYESYYMQFQPLSLLHVLRIWRLTSSSAILARQTIHKTFILFDFGKIWTVLFPNVATKLHVVIQE